MWKDNLYCLRCAFDLALYNATWLESPDTYVAIGLYFSNYAFYFSIAPSEFTKVKSFDISSRNLDDFNSDKTIADFVIFPFLNFFNRTVSQRMRFYGILFWVILAFRSTEVAHFEILDSCKLIFIIGKL